MLKHLADAAGPVVVLTYFVNNVIPVATPVVVFAGAIAALVWYGIRFYEYFKNDRLGD